MTANTEEQSTRDATRREASRSAIEAFVQHEARLLDDRRFEEWMELFAEDGCYWVPTVPGQKDPLRTASLFYDDRRAMKARFTRLKHPRIHVQTPPSRTRHLVTGIELQPPGAPDEYLVSSNFIMLEYRPGYEQRLYGGGFLHRLRHANGRLSIVMKRVDLINCDASFSAMAIPF